MHLHYLPHSQKQTVTHSVAILAQAMLAQATRQAEPGTARERRHAGAGIHPLQCVGGYPAR